MNLNNNNNNFNVIPTVVQGHTFTISSRYQPGKILGRGSFGVVCTAFDTINQQNVAIKRIRPFANDEWDARHTLREIRLMKLLGKHPNVITLYSLSIFEEKSELYMVMELMDCDLHRIIQSKQPLNDMHYKCFAKQMLEGIRAMHEIGVFHRDLKPGNILVSKDCQLRITDFGLARFIDKVTLSGNNRQNPLTEYVVTRWYRCPELLLSPNLPYSAAIDIWSIGCIIGELIKRKPLFPGKSHANQVQLILEVRGYTDPSSFGFELSSEAASFLDRKCRFAGKPLSSFIPQASNDALELLEPLLDLNPKRRPSAARCLQYAYLRDAQILCDYNSNVMPRKVDEKYFDFERVEYSLEALQNMVREEVIKPCDDSIFFPEENLPTPQQTLERKTLSKSVIRDSPSNRSQKNLSSNFNSSNSSNVTTTGGSSILSSASDIYSTENDEAIQYYQQQQQIQQNQQQQNQNNKNYTPARDAIDRSDSTQTIPTGLQSNSKMNRSKSAPPSPSPQKMEMITKQEKKHKRRFFLQGLQKLRQDQSGNEQTNVNSARSDRQVMSGITNDELTSRRDIIQPSGVLRSGIQHLTSTVSNSNMNSTNTNTSSSSTSSSSTSLRSTSNKYNYSTSTNESNDLTPHLNSQFQNLGVSYGGYHVSNNNIHEPPIRKLSSAPPVEARITRLPALQQKLLPVRLNNNNNNNNNSSSNSNSNNNNIINNGSNNMMMNNYR